MSDREMERLARLLRGWAERPPRRSAGAARRRVVASLPSRRRRPAWQLAAGGATLAAAALALVFAIGNHEEPAAVSPAAVSGVQPTIVHQLRSGTKLYIVVRPGES